MRKILIFILGLYLVFSLMYFGHKIFPILEQYLTKPVPKIEEIVIVPKKISLGNCEPFSLGHIAENEFRIFTRIDKDKETIEIDENDLQTSIANRTCDKAGTQALIFYDSQPISIANISNYDYSKPFGKKTKNKAIIYSILKDVNKISNYPESGFVLALYNFDRTNILQYQTKISTITKMDEDLINGHNDTLFLENTHKEAKGIESEYETIKTDLDKSGEEDLLVLSTWTDKTLPVGVHYTTIYVLNNINGSELSRQDILPFTKTRKSKFFLSQIIDVDSDGKKEIVIRKSREGNDSFLIYKLDKINNVYININIESGEKIKEKEVE